MNIESSTDSLMVIADELLRISYTIKPRDTSLSIAPFISIYDYFFQCNAQFKCSWHIFLGDVPERLLDAMLE